MGLVGGSDGGSDGGLDGGSGGGSSPLSFGEPAKLSSREAGSAEGLTGPCVGLSSPGSPVFAGGAAGSLGRGAGLAALTEGEACSGTVVGSAGVGIGVGVGRAGGVGTSKAAGVNAIGGSKRANVVTAKESLNIPVHVAAHIGSRANIFVGGMISGSHGAPMVVTTVPSADVLVPKPQVGQARSLISSGAIPATGARPASGLAISEGSCQISPTVNVQPPSDGFHVDSSPGARVMIGSTNSGPTVVHRSLTTAVPINWR